MPYLAPLTIVFVTTTTSVPNSLRRISRSDVIGWLPIEGVVFKGADVQSLLMDQSQVHQKGRGGLMIRFTSDREWAAQIKMRGYGFVRLLSIFSAVGMNLGHADDKSSILLTGSSTVAPLAQSLAEVFESNNSNIRVEVQTGGSSKGISDCKKGLNKLGMISRDLKDSETSIEAIPIAMDGLAFIVNQKVKLDNLSPQQIIQIYRGEVSNWSQLAGSNLRILPVSKAEGRGTLDLFKEKFNLNSSEIRAGVIIGDESHGVKTVESSDGAIGFVSYATAKRVTDKSGQKVKVLSIRGLQPSSAAIKSGAYPYARKLQFVACSKLSAQGQAFIDFARSEKGQHVVESVGYVPL